MWDGRVGRKGKFQASREASSLGQSAWERSQSLSTSYVVSLQLVKKPDFSDGSEIINLLMTGWVGVKTCCGPLIAEEGRVAAGLWVGVPTAPSTQAPLAP